ncbi:hypothetical protein [Streptomyces antnestii]|nr:hypothetical protein [Streptomyces sp. San01]
MSATVLTPFHGQRPCGAGLYARDGGPAPTPACAPTPRDLTATPQLEN